MEAAGSSEPSLNVYQATTRHIPDDLTFHKFLNFAIRKESYFFLSSKCERNVVCVCMADSKF